MRKTKGRDTIRAARVQKTSEVTGLSPRQVRRVTQGDQQNEKVMEVYMKIEEGENLLLEAVKQLVP